MSILEHAIPLVSQDPFEPGTLIDHIKPHFPSEFGKVLEIHEKYTLERHTLMVLGQFEKYFSHSPLPAGLEKSHFRMFLAIHDLGKPEAELGGRKEDQVIYNPKRFEEHFPREPFIDGRTRHLLWSLLTGDPIGNQLKTRGKNLHAVLGELEYMYRLTTDVSRGDYMDVLLVYYMSDAGSYTRDAGGIPSLDRLFDFRTGSMGFSALSKPLVDVLVDRFTNS